MCTTCSSTTTETFVVTGMTCDHCSRAVASEIGALTGVTDVRVDLASGRVDVTSERSLSTDEVREAVDEAGYQLAP
jgi:copper chaperone